MSKNALEGENFLHLNDVCIQVDCLIENDLESSFCGKVIINPNEKDKTEMIQPANLIYACGDIEKILNMFQKNLNSNQIIVIEDLSYHFDKENVKSVPLSQVPLQVHDGLGLWIKDFFPHDKDFYDLIKQQHQFQQLTQSSKSGSAFRKGIYITEVKEKLDKSCTFHLLRCSTNLDGPTDNVRSIDREIISTVNQICELFFDTNVNLNHVLAQDYINTSTKKARISSHSDKTKDMPREGLIAFCSFYSKFDNTCSTKDPNDYVYNGQTSIFPSLVFKLKDDVKDEDLVKEFSIKLYPNSLFVIPLSTNRLYTHEIRPSLLPPDKLPTRLGYVIRSSNTLCTCVNQQNYIDTTPLHEMSQEEQTTLEKLYLEENTTSHVIHYPRPFFSSMNQGDYKPPKL